MMLVGILLLLSNETYKQFSNFYFVSSLSFLSIISSCFSQHQRPGHRVWLHHYQDYWYHQ